MGLYLVIGNGVQKNDLVYTTLPFFALLPEQDLSSNTGNYHIVAKSKPQPNPVLDDFEVIKIWDDKCHKNEQHKPITIQLICDGEVYDTITLPYEGAWKYTWYQLEVNHVWTVQEPEKVDGYKDPDIRQEGNTFIVTNTCNRPTTQPTQPGKPTLPQTGQLWWPVPVLIATGLLFVVIGLIRRRGAGDE
ncbi:MAG: Cna B-type domain-containing protein [Faecousia sp.]